MVTHWSLTQEVAGSNNILIIIFFVIGFRKNSNLRVNLISIFSRWDLKNKCSGGSKGDTPGMCPSTDQNFLNFIQFLGKFVCWRLPLEGWHPFLWRILDLPLKCLSHNTTKWSPSSCFCCHVTGILHSDWLRGLLVNCVLEGCQLGLGVACNTDWISCCCAKAVTPLKIKNEPNVRNLVS